jgi:hypothetical protein
VLVDEYDTSVVKAALESDRIYDRLMTADTKQRREADALPNRPVAMQGVEDAPQPDSEDALFAQVDWEKIDPTTPVPTAAAPPVAAPPVAALPVDALPAVIEAILPCPTVLCRGTCQTR